MTFHEYSRLRRDAVSAGAIQSVLDAITTRFHQAHGGKGSGIGVRVRTYVGGLPPRRIYRSMLAHEVRARKYGVPYDLVDYRDVYRDDHGTCGICGQPVGFDEFVVDHIIPMSDGGPHLRHNLQAAHLSCNAKKGRKHGTPKALSAAG